MENQLLSLALTEQSFSISIMPAVIDTLVFTLLAAVVGFYLRFIWALRREVAQSHMLRTRRFLPRKISFRVSRRGITYRRHH
jgi:hypothetical protein